MTMLVLSIDNQPAHQAPAVGLLLLNAKVSQNKGSIVELFVCFPYPGAQLPILPQPVNQPSRTNLRSQFEFRDGVLFFAT